MPSQPWGTASFVSEHGREKEEEEEEMMETCIEMCERTLASHSLLASKAAEVDMNEAAWYENHRTDS